MRLPGHAAAPAGADQQLTGLAGGQAYIETAEPGGGNVGADLLAQRCQPAGLYPGADYRRVAGGRVRDVIAVE